MFADPGRNGETRSVMKCLQCGSCCRVEGKVWLSLEDVARLVDHCGVQDMEELRKIGIMKNTYLAEKDHYECIFLEGNRCAVHHIKPDQCRLSPPGGRLCREARWKCGLP